MKKNGFTLIESLAVIIILGIIMLIAIPAISKYIFSSDKSIYASDIIAYMESVRGEYEMKEYGSLLKDDEIMIVPLEYVNLEKGSKSSPFGDFNLAKSYIVIAPSRNGYEFYANVVDEQGFGVVMKKQLDLDEDAIEENISLRVDRWDDYLDPNKEFEYKNIKYKKCELRNKKIEEETIENAALVLCTE